MKPKDALSVACLVDEDIVDGVRKSLALQRPASERTNSNERVRIKYAASVVRVLSQLYRRVEIVTAIGRGLRTLDIVAALRPDVVVNLAFSSHPSEAPVVGGLDLLGIPYTGSGPLGIALAGDKVLSRHVLRSVGVRVPRFVELPARSPHHAIEIDLEPPLIVKPATLASSVGIHERSVVMKRQDVAVLASDIWIRHGVRAMCEEFVVGREFRAALVETKDGGVRVAGVTEWHFGGARKGWGFRTEATRASVKTRQGRKVSRTVVSPSDKRCAEFAAIGQRAMSALRVRGYSIVDLRVDEQDRVTVLEVNPNPGLWADGATWSHPSFETTLKEIVAAAFRKRSDQFTSDVEGLQWQKA